MKRHKREGHQLVRSRSSPADLRKVLQPDPARRRADDPRHRRRRAGREGASVGEPQAVEAGAATGVLYRHARRSASATACSRPIELMTRHFGWDRPPKASLGDRDHGLSARPRAALARRRQPRFDLPSRRAEQGRDPAADRGTGPPQRAGAGRARRRRQAASIGRGPRRWRRRSSATPSRCTSSRRSIRSSSSASAPNCSSTTGTASRPMCRRKSACSAISRCRCWSATTSSPRVDLKTDRKSRKLLMQKWNWVGAAPRSAKGTRKELKRRIEEELHRFERFQLAE